MFFYGWGRNSKTWELVNKLPYTWVVCQYTYFNIFFIFQIALSRKWIIGGENRSDDKVITYYELKNILPENTPKLNPWESYGMLITFSLLVLWVIGSLVVSSF
jgi:hypothetical protein